MTQEGATLWPQYRAREHELILAPWSPDYVERARVAQRVSGPNFDHVWYRVVTKESAAAPP